MKAEYGTYSSMKMNTVFQHCTSEFPTAHTHTHTRTPTSYCTEGGKCGQLEVRAVTVMLVALCARPGGMFRQKFLILI